jgi:hypothetical protein
MKHDTWGALRADAIYLSEILQVVVFQIFDQLVYVYMTLMVASFFESQVL